MLQFDTQAMPAAGQKLGSMPQNTESDPRESGEITFADLVVADEAAAVPRPEQVVGEPGVPLDVEETVDAPLPTQTKIEAEEAELPKLEVPDAELSKLVASMPTPTSRSPEMSRQDLIAGLAQNGRISINSGPVQTVRLPVQEGATPHPVLPTQTQLNAVTEVSQTRAPLAPATAIQAAVTSLAQSSGKPREDLRSELLMSPRSTRSGATPATPVPPQAPPNLILTVPTPLTTVEKQALPVDQFGMASLEPESIAAQQSSAQQTQQSVIAPMPLRVNAQPVAAQIAVALFQSKGATTEISLNPQELGKVRISMTSGDAGLVVNILAERPETTDLMRRNIDSLAREFQDLGYEQLSFSFSDGERRSDQESTETSAPTNIMMAPETDQPVQRAVALGTLDLKL